MPNDATRTAAPDEQIQTVPLGENTVPGSTTLPGLRRVGRFEIVGELARGGMGVVYRAHDPGIDREVAVKVLADDLASRPHAVRRFLDEAKITGQLQHPGIPPVHEVGHFPDGGPFLAMKLIKGRTLDALLKERSNPAQDRGRFVAVFEQICQAVGYAHSRGVVHRDLKPANVMVGAFGEVQVMDWGLAKVLTRQEDEPTDPDETAGTEIRSTREADEATRAGSVLGTPAFMPPEQAIGAVDQIDARSDVFGLGAILCAILTGKPPYVGLTSESTRQLAAQGKLGDALARLNGCGAESELVALCTRCLTVEKSARPVDGGAVAAEIDTLRTAYEVRARQAELDRERANVRIVEERKRRRLMLGAVVAAFLLAGVAGWQAVQAREALSVARTASESRDTAILKQKQIVLGFIEFLAANQGVSERQKEALLEAFLKDHMDVNQADATLAFKQALPPSPLSFPLGPGAGFGKAVSVNMMGN